MPKIKAYIFDLGGVVINPEVEKIKNIMSELTGIQYRNYNSFSNEFRDKLTKGQLTLREFYSALVANFGVTNLSEKELTTKHLQEFVKVLNVINEDVIKVIKSLKLNCKVVCMVNEELDVIPILRKHGIYKNFDRSFISAKLGMQKPEPNFYQHVLKKLRVKPEETVFIDDKIENVRAAKKIGIRAVRYKWGSDLGMNLKKKKLLN